MCEKERKYLIGQIETTLQCCTHRLMRIPENKPLEVTLAEKVGRLEASSSYKISSLSIHAEYGLPICEIDDNDKTKTYTFPVYMITLDGLHSIVRFIKENAMVEDFHPKPINISEKAWDFIERILPNYKNRYDVLRQSELQVLIDSNTSTNDIGMTIEEAIQERNKLLLQIYIESINTFTKPCPEGIRHAGKEQLLQDILTSQGSCMLFAEILLNKIQYGDATYDHVGYRLIQAYLKNDCYEMINILCGQTIDDILLEYIDAEKKESV